MARQNKGENMKNHIHFVISALSVAIFALLAPTSFAQKGAAMQKAQAIAQQLNLTPQQKEKILPILADEVPKTKSDSSTDDPRCRTRPILRPTDGHRSVAEASKSSVSSLCRGMCRS